MGGVVLGTQHHLEKPAGALAGLAQELSAGAGTLPVFCHGDYAPVAQPKGGNVDGITPGMFA
jgi:hypothetical protein